MVKKTDKKNKDNMKRILKIICVCLILVLIPTSFVSADQETEKESIRSLSVPVDRNETYNVNGTDVDVHFSGYIYKDTGTNTITNWNISITSSNLDTIYGFFVMGNVLYANFRLRVDSQTEIIVQYLP